MLNNELFDAIVTAIQKDGREYFAVTIDSIVWTLTYETTPSLYLMQKRSNHDSPPLGHCYFIFYSNNTLTIGELNRIHDISVDQSVLRSILVNLYNIFYAQH